MGFCLYSTVNVDTAKVIKTLNGGIFGGEDHQLWSLSDHSFVGEKVSSIVRHHRKQPGSFNPRYFVVADRSDWELEGVLAVNLDFKGFIDAMRMKANEAGDAIPSVDIGNTDWYECLAPSRTRPYPPIVFAVNTWPEVELEVTEGKLLWELNSGLEGRKNAFLDLCRLVQYDRPTDISTIAKDHSESCALRRCQDYHKSMFIVADDPTIEEYGVLLVKIGDDGEVDTRRKPIDVAVEVLTWIDQGLYTWQEGKDWDDEELAME